MTPLESATGTVQIRDLLPSDVPELMAILGESPEAARWPAEAFQNGLTESTIAIVAIRAEAVVGFLVGRFAADEFEILNLAVSRSSRRLGIASKLVKAGLIRAHQAGCKRCYLEVRASNETAQALYFRHGFQTSGRRRDYYREPVEDAAVLVRGENQA